MSQQVGKPLRVEMDITEAMINEVTGCFLVFNPDWDNATDAAEEALRAALRVAPPMRLCDAPNQQSAQNLGKVSGSSPHRNVMAQLRA